MGGLVPRRHRDRGAAAVGRRRARDRLRVARAHRRAARPGRGPARQPAAGHGLLRARPPRGRGPHDRAPRRSTTRFAGRFSWVAPDPQTLRPVTRRLEPNPDEDAHAIGPDFDDPDLDKDLWRFRRIAARGLFAPGAYPSDITIVNWPQADYTDAVVLEGDGGDRRARSAGRFLHWMQTEGGWPGLRLRGDVVGDTPDGLAKAPYIREARRLRSLRTVVEQDIALAVRGRHGAVAFPDAVGVGHYRIDLHPSTGGDPYLDLACCPFQLPLGALVPAADREPARGRQVPRHDAHHERRLPPAPGRVERRRGRRAPGGVLPRAPHHPARRLRAARPAGALPVRARRGRDRAGVAGGDPRAGGLAPGGPGAGILHEPADRCRPRLGGAVATVARMRHRPTTAGLSRSPFPPIADYGFLSDCETTALVAPDGSVEWMCLPRMDSPSVFGALLDRDAGWFRLGPTGVKVPAGRRYLPGTMVLETSWGTKGGWVIVRDALLIGPWHHHDDRSNTHTPHADRLRRRPRPAAHRPLRQRRGAARPGMRAGVRLRPTPRRAGSTTATTTTAPSPARPAPTSSCASPPT